MDSLDKPLFMIKIQILFSNVTDLVFSLVILFTRTCGDFISLIKLTKRVVSELKIANKQRKAINLELEGKFEVNYMLRAEKSGKIVKQ